MIYKGFQLNFRQNICNIVLIFAQNLLLMESLYIEGSAGHYFRPYVDFNAETGVCELAGESHLENAFGFYQELQNWVEQYDGDCIIFRFKLTFFNTSSSKGILNLLKALKKRADEGLAVQVIWYYPRENYDLRAEAEDFMDDIEMDITLISYHLD